MPCLLTEAGHLLVSVAGATLRTTAPILPPATYENMAYPKWWPTLAGHFIPEGPQALPALPDCLSFTLVFLYDLMKPSPEPSGGHPAIILGFAGITPPPKNGLSWSLKVTLRPFKDANPCLTVHMVPTAFYGIPFT